MLVKSQICQQTKFYFSKILSKHLAAIHEIHDTVNEGVTGKMKDEFERIPVHKFNGLKPKNVLYCF